MGVIKRNCPHCRTQSVSFKSAYQWPVSNGVRALFLCERCSEGVVWAVILGHAPVLTNASGDLEKLGTVFLEQWPDAPSGTAPLDTPPNASNFFEQGTSSLEAGNFDAAGMMFRKTVESATKILDPDSVKMPLVKRIDSLAKAGKLTEDLAQWAHEARLGGNEAAHEDEPFSADQADNLRNFVENFLRYSFTLPSAVKRREGQN